MDNQERFLLQEPFAYMLIESDNECKIINQFGAIMPYEQMLEVAKKLINYANNHKVEIATFNARKAIEVEDWLHTKTNPHKEKEGRYIYLFKSNKRYKIGCTKDVNRRLNELNNRPFLVELVCCSKSSPKAFKQERALHESLKKI